MTLEDRGTGELIGSRGGLPAGTITIDIGERYPYKTPAAACFAYLNGKVDRPLTRYQVGSGWDVSVFDLLPNQDAGCYVYFFAPSPSYVYINVFECPVGFDATIAGPTELKQNCPLAQTPVEFLLQNVAGVHHEYSAAGGVMFRYLDAGDLTLREAVPAGFGVPAVYCETFHRRADGAVITVRQYDRQILSAVDAIQSSIGDVGDAVECDWFNLPGALPDVDDGRPPLLDTTIPVPEGNDGGEMTIQPVPPPAGTTIIVPESDEDGVVTILPVPEITIPVPEGDGGGDVSIQPVPDPAGTLIEVPEGDGGGEVSIQPVPTPEATTIVVPEGDEGEVVTILPVPAEDAQP